MPLFLPRFTKLLLIGVPLLMHAPITVAETENDRLKFDSFDQRARKGDRLTVVFLGGSLTWGAQATNPQVTSYRARMEANLEAHYPAAHFQFRDAAIGGTGSQLAAFRLDRDVLSYHPDLVFLDFTINDDANPVDSDRLASYESIIRRLLQNGTPVLQAIFSSRQEIADPTLTRPLPSAHKEIARAYGLPVADAIIEGRRQVAEKKTSPEKLWDVPGDGIHPGDAGYALYAETVWSAYLRAVDEKIRCRLPEKMLHADTYSTANRQRLSALAPLPAGWKISQPNRSGSSYDFVMSRWLDDVTIARAGKDQPAPSALRLKIFGNTVLLFGECTPASGRYQITIDGGAAKTYDARAEGGNSRLVEVVARWPGAPAEHLLEVIPLLELGQELRLESICVAGGPASVLLSK